MKTINLTLIKKELLFDISIIAYTVGDCMPEESAIARYKVQGVVDEENIRKINLIIHSAWRDIITALTAYILNEHQESTDVNDSQVISDTYTIALTAPNSLPEETAETLTRHAHDYIVNRGVAQWFLMTKKDETEIYATLANNDITQLKKIMTLRKHPTRIDGWKL